MKKYFKDGDHVWLHGMSSFPAGLVDLVIEHCSDVHLTFHSLHLEGAARFAEALRNNSNWKYQPFFVNGETRDVADYIPMPLSLIPSAIQHGTIRVDVAIVSSNNGYLGLSCDCTGHAVSSARTVLNQQNFRLPMTGDKLATDGWLQIIETFVIDTPIPSHNDKPARPEELAIAEHVASCITDGATIQLGIGAIPSLVAAQLAKSGKKNIRIFSEMISDPVMDLARGGCLVNEPIVTSFASGSKAFMRWLETYNVKFVASNITNDPANIAKFDNFISVNSIIEIDLRGNVCNSSIGSRHYSGVGGSFDFVYGANLSNGGQSFLCLKSVNKYQESTIKNFLSAGAEVNIPMHLTDNVVTEYGVARLRGKSLSERKDALIQIAHPNHRELLGV